MAEIVETLAGIFGIAGKHGTDFPTDEYHQHAVLADLLTVGTHLPGKAFNEMTLVYAGDARNNMGQLHAGSAALTVGSPSGRAKSLLA